VVLAKAGVEKPSCGESRLPFGATTLAFGELPLTYGRTPNVIGTKQHLLPLSTSLIGAWDGAHLRPAASTMGGGGGAPATAPAFGEQPWEGAAELRSSGGRGCCGLSVADGGTAVGSRRPGSGGQGQARQSEL
jgi:hypothetical protein